MHLQIMRRRVSWKRPCILIFLMAGGYFASAGDQQAAIKVGGFDSVEEYKAANELGAKEQG